MSENKEENAAKEIKKSNITEKVRQNPWVLSTIVLGVLVLVFVAVNFTGMGKLTGNAVANNLVGYLNTVVDSEVKFVSVEEQSGLYKVIVDYQGQDLPVYMTKDGKYYTATLLPLTSQNKTSSNARTQTQQTPQNVPKTDKPSVELYVFAYCPYGLQMEKAMIPVVKLLKDKINFKIRQIGAMHGDFEKVEAQRQLCINKNYPDKYLDYVLAFAEDTSCPNGAESCITTKLNTLYAKFGFDAAKINSCMTTDGLTMYNAEVSNANSKGVSGSPTLIVNGADVQASRSQDGILTSICSAFTTSPSECSQKLSTSQASAGFGAGAGSASSGTQCATP